MIFLLINYILLFNKAWSMSSGHAIYLFIYFYLKSLISLVINIEWYIYICILFFKCGQYNNIFTFSKLHSYIVYNYLFNFK